MMTAIFGPLVVPSVMAVIVWNERGKHNAKTKRQFTDPTDWWRSKPSARLSIANIAVPTQRQMKISDAMNCSGILSLAVVALIPPAVWWSLFLADFLLAAHPTLCVTWWLKLRWRNVVHAEVYPLATWIVAYASWAAARLVPAEWFRYLESGSIDWSGSVVYGFWILYVASGIAFAIGGIALARMSKPPCSPLICVSVWVPVAFAVWALTVFGFLALVMTVGVAGFGISREVRRLRDEAGARDSAVAPTSHPRASQVGSLRLIASVGAVVIMASALSIGIRESGLLNQVGIIVVTWSAPLVASLLAGWFARRDGPARNVAAWAAGAFIAVTSLVSFQFMLAETWPWFSDPSWVLEASVEGEPSTFMLFTYVQALAVGLVAAVLLVVAVMRGQAREYGAMLLGILWVPIALATAGVHSDIGRAFALIDPVGIAGATAMGCVLLVIMWRVFGPGETTAETSQTKAVESSHLSNVTAAPNFADVESDHVAGISTSRSRSNLG